MLATKIESRRGFFGMLGAKRHKDGLESDRRALIKYYQDNGFFDVKVSATTRPGKELGEEQITFTISEGAQYKVRKIVFEGNKQLAEAKLREGMLLKPGQPYNEAMREHRPQDHQRPSTGASAASTPRSRRTSRSPTSPGCVDVVYRIEEGNPYILGQIIIRGNARTKDKVIRREALMAGLLPGEVLDMNRLETFKKRLGNTGYFVKRPGSMGKPIDVQIINQRPGDKPFGDGRR